jgi:hypothetical protein
MSGLIKKIEVAANLAIIAVAILLGVVLVRNYLMPKPQAPPQAAAAPIPPGTKLSLPGVDWKANGRTLVMALSTGCHFCTESAPFYQRVAQERAKVGNIRLVAVFPEPVSEGQKYLNNLGVAVDEVKQAQLDSIGVIGTPTLIITDVQGTVAESWRGKLPSEKESDLLSHLK